MKLKKLLAAVTAAALAVTTMAVASFTASAEDVDVTSKCRFVLKLNSSNGETTNYDGNYNGTSNATSLTVNASNINGADESTGLSFLYAVEPFANNDFKVNDEIKVSITGLTIKAKKSNNEETIVNGNDIQWTQKFMGSYWSGDKPLTLNSISFDNLSDFKTNGEITATWTGLTVTMAGKDESGDNPTPDTQTVDLAFPTGAIELTYIEDADDGNTEKAKADIELTLPAALTGKTYGELSGTTLKLKDVNFKNCSLDGVAATDVTVMFYTLWKTGEWKWKPASAANMSASEITFDLSTITGVENTDDLVKCGVQFVIPVSKLDGLKLGDKVTINGSGSSSGEDPAPPPSGSGLKTWNGASTGEDDRYAIDLNGKNITPADIKTVELRVSGNVEYGKFAIAAQCENQPWSAGDFVFNASPSGQTISVTFGETDANTWNSATQTDDVAPNTINFPADVGKWVKLTLYPSYLSEGSSITLDSVTLKDASGNVLLTVPASSSGGDTEIPGGDTPVTPPPVTPVEPDTPDTPSTPSTPSTPDTPNTPNTPSTGGGPTYAPSIPSSASGSSSNSPAPVTSTTIVDTILATPDGGNGSVSLGSSTKLDKEALEALITKSDVTIRFNVAGGAYWEINGTNVTEAKNVDLGVKMNGNLIPANKISEFAGDKKTIQFTLRHNGDFGFNGVLNVPVGKANSGKFANLYYYHGGKFDFVGSSAISDGMAKFVFSHASSYLIVIDDYAYGEDVSSAAGMTETAPEASAFPYVAVLAVIAAFGVSLIVLKKRLSK